MSLEKANNNSMIIKYQNTDNVLEDICSIIESARNYAYQSVNIALVERNWFIGYRIAEEELKGQVHKFKEFWRSILKRFQEMIGFNNDEKYKYVSDDLYRNGIFDDNDNEIANDVARKVKTVDEINNSKNNRKRNNDTRF